MVNHLRHKNNTFKGTFTNGDGRISTLLKPASLSICLAFSRPHIAPSPIASKYEFIRLPRSNSTRLSWAHLWTPALLLLFTFAIAGDDVEICFPIWRIHALVDKGLKPLPLLAALRILDEGSSHSRLTFFNFPTAAFLVKCLPYLFALRFVSLTLHMLLWFFPMQLFDLILKTQNPLGGTRLWPEWCYFTSSSHRWHGCRWHPHLRVAS